MLVIPQEHLFLRQISGINTTDSSHQILLMGSLLRGKMNQSVPETREMNESMVFVSDIQLRISPSQGYVQINNGEIQTVICNNH